MHSYQRAMAVALATFGASVLGMALQLAELHLKAGFGSSRHPMINRLILTGFVE